MAEVLGVASHVVVNSDPPAKEYSDIYRSICSRETQNLCIHFHGSQSMATNVFVGKGWLVRGCEAETRVVI